jgi:hypothetical protein
MVRVCLPLGRFCSNLMNGPLDVAPLEIGELELLHRLLPALHLAGARAGGEAGHEVLELGDLLLLLGVLRLDPGANLRLGHHHVVVPARVGDDGLVVDVRDVGADRVEEVPVVADGDQDALVLVEEGLQPADGVEVEVVRWLVEEERLRLAEQRLCEEHPELEATGNLPHQPGVVALGNAETGEQGGRVALGGVAVLLGDDRLEVGQPVPVVVGQLGLVEQPLLLLEDRPECLVALEHHVQDADVLVRELVLLQHRGLLRAADGTGVGVELTGEDLHEGRLAGAVRAGEAVAAVLGEGDVDVLEEALLAVGLGDLGDLQRGHGLGGDAH